MSRAGMYPTKTKNMIRSKYKNQKIELEGKKFDSKAEAQMYLTLKQMQENGDIQDLKTQMSFTLIPSQTVITGEKLQSVRYRADFVFFDKRMNRLRILDCKGFKTKDYIIKKKLFAHLFQEYMWCIEEKI